MPPLLSKTATQSRIQHAQPYLQGRILDIMLAVFEHLQRPEPLLLQARQVLDTGGRLVLTTPTPFGDIVHRIGGRINLFYSEQIVAHVKIYRRKELFRLAEAAGFSVHHYRRFLYQTNHLLVCQAAD